MQYSRIGKNPKRLFDLQEKAKLLNDGKGMENQLNLYDLIRYLIE